MRAEEIDSVNRTACQGFANTQHSPIEGVCKGHGFWFCNAARIVTNPDAIRATEIKFYDALSKSDQCLTESYLAKEVTYVQLLKAFSSGVMVIVD